jgi:hypothetical protein
MTDDARAGKCQTCRQMKFQKPKILQEAIQVIPLCGDQCILKSENENVLLQIDEPFLVFKSNYRVYSSVLIYKTIIQLT